MAPLLHPRKSRTYNQMKTLCALLLICIAGLGYYSYQQHEQLSELQAKLAALASESTSDTPVAASQEAPPAQSPKIAAAAEPVPAPAEQAPPVAETAKPTERIMEDLSQMMMENPQVNEMMQASQRASLEVMYKDLLDSFDFSPEERIHFMDLLMARQMFRVESSMKMMGGASNEEKTLLASEMKEYDDQVKSAIDTFLNNDKDSAEFEFFEKTLGERMSLSGFKNSMQNAGKPIAPETERSLLQIMADQKSNFQFTSDLADETNFNMGPERFSSENIDKFQTDMEELHNIIAEEAQALLDPEQLAALAQSLEGMRQMQISQLRMAANMFAPKTEE